MDEAAPALWRRLARHAATLLIIGLTSAIAAPTVATFLLAARANGLSYQIVFALTLTPLAIVLGGPGAFLLGLVFGWMLLVLATQGLNSLPLRLGLALLLATLAWWLAEPFPTAEQSEAPTAHAAGDWPIWAGSAAVTALIFTRGWVAHRLRHPTPLPREE